jgi:hypothetical protein
MQRHLRSKRRSFPSTVAAVFTPAIFGSALCHLRSACGPKKIQFQLGEKPVAKRRAQTLCSDYKLTLGSQEADGEKEALRTQTPLKTPSSQRKMKAEPRIFHRVKGVREHARSHNKSQLPRFLTAATTTIRSSKLRIEDSGAPNAGRGVNLPKQTVRIAMRAPTCTFLP